MALSIRNYTIIKVVQVTHQQDNFKYVTSWGIKCSCMSLISVTWTLFRSAGLWDKFDLDCMLGKWDQFFKFIGNFRYLERSRVLRRKLVYNVGFLDDKTGEITAGAYLISIAEFINGVQQIRTGALLIVNNYILGLIREMILCICLILIVKMRMAIYRGSG